MPAFLTGHFPLCLLFALLALAPLAADDYLEDFDEPDGAPADWFVYQPEAAIDLGWLALRATQGVEPFAWAGLKGEPIAFDAIRSVRFQVEFAGFPGDVVGRHGGAVLCCSEPTQRWAGTFSGYMIDWIDRPDDHGYRIHKITDGVAVALAVGSTQNDPGTDWRIDFEDDAFTLTVDGEEIGRYEDAEYRSGYVGLWCYLNAGQELIFDDLHVEHTPATCPEILPAGAFCRPGEPPLTVTVRIPLGANETAPYEVTVTSTDPAVAIPAGAAGDSLVLAFPAGGAQAQAFEVEARSPGTARFVLSVPGADCPDAYAEIEVRPPAESRFIEEFAEPDGPPEDWYVQNPEGNVVGEALVLEASLPATEPTAWAGIAGIPIPFPDIVSIRFRLQFGGMAEGPIFDHGGVAFCMRDPATRWNNPGYTVDWLARDGVYRILKATETAQIALATAPAAGPAEDWRIDLTGSLIIFYADDVEIARVEDGEHREGYIGFWAYSNTGQQMTVDDVEVTFAASECPAIAPAGLTAWPGEPDPIFTVRIPIGANDAGDYELTVTTSDPDVAVPEGAEGDHAVLTFRPGDPPVRDLEVSRTGTGTARLALSVEGAECPDAWAEVTFGEFTEGFADDFEEPDGPPANWTIFSRTWQVEGGELVTEYMGGGFTPWIWAGDPPARFGPIETIEFRLAFDNLPADVVGRHGGIMFFAQAPTRRWSTSGYEIDWIDRIDDHGYRFIRYDDGVETLLAGPTGDLFPEPGAQWRIEIDADVIAFYADDEFIFEAFDSGYRQGHVGLWSYGNGTRILFDDVAIGAPIGPGQTAFIRGSADGDAKMTIGDAIRALNYLFAGGPAPSCLKAADCDDSGRLTIGDPVLLLNYLFAQGRPPAAPSPGCGIDPTPDDRLTCESFSGCP